MKSFKTLFALMLIVLGSIGVFAQVNTKATVMGKVVDDTGAPLPGVTVLLTNVETGYKRSVVTDENGRFQAPYLPLGKYNVEASLAGFSKYTAKNLTLSLGDVITLNITLKPEKLEETITVTAEAPLIEVNKVDVESKISDQYIESLPVNGRDFKDFVMLTPGVVEAAGNRVAGEGTRGIMNNLQIDGAGYNSTFFGEQRGSTRIPFTFSQETIKEFNVIQNGYSAQYGDASGIIINAVTKSGSNEYKGSAWWYKRKNEWMSSYAPNEYIKDLAKRQVPEFDLDQFGFTFSGPIIKDKLFFFFSYDGQRKDLTSYREFRPNAGIDEFRQMFPDIVKANEGWWPGTEDNDVYFLKLDWNINEDHHLTFRINYQDFEAVNGTNKYRTSGITNNGLEKDKSLSIVAELTSVLNENMYNDLRVQYAREQRPRYANTTDMMEVVIGYYDAVFGQNNFLPNGLDEDTVEIMDDFTWMLGDHTIKAGFRYANFKYDDYFFRYQGGRISFYGNYYDFIAWADDDPNTNPRKFYKYTQSFSDIDGRVNYNSDEFALYIEDEWQVTDKLFIAAGLRWEAQYYDDMINPNPDLMNVDLPEYTGYTAGGYNLQQIPDDSDNIAPRFALTYDIKGDGSQLIRFGAGYFYSRTPSLLVANAMLTNGINVVRMDFYPGDPLFPHDLTDRIDPSELTPENQRPPTVYFFAPDFENPYTFKTSLSYEAKLNENWKFGIDLKYTRGYHFERKLDVNLGIKDADHDGVQDTDDCGRLLWDYRHRPNRDFGQMIMFKSDAESKASSVTFRIEKRYADRWSMFASYTLTSAYDNDTNERSVSSSSSFPTNPANLMDDWGRSDYYHKGMFKLSFTVDIGWGVKLSGYHRFYTGRPWSILDGGDANGDYYRNDRACIDGVVVARNTKRQPNFSQTDLRLSKVFRIWRGQTLEFMIDCFNVFDKANRTTTNYYYGSRWFGTLNHSTLTPRTLQLGVKYRF